jgi:hypothetical protein
MYALASIIVSRLLPAPENNSDVNSTLWSRLYSNPIMLSAWNGFFGNNKLILDRFNCISKVSKSIVHTVKDISQLKET